MCYIQRPSHTNGRHGQENTAGQRSENRRVGGQADRRTGGQEGVGGGLADAEQLADFADGDGPMLTKIRHHGRMVPDDPVALLSLAVVPQLAVPFDRRESGLSAAEELAVGDVAVAEDIDLPVPGAEHGTVVAVEPELRRGQFLDGIARNGIFEKGNDPEAAHGRYLRQIAHIKRRMGRPLLRERLRKMLSLQYESCRAASV